ncbi:MAG: helix-turn-helix domain-containing protein [Roseburia sp.]|nr:helix-turn-helix domain-containing protein [Roseburia sp.]
MTANEIKEIRSQLGLSQEALAERLGVHARTIQNWESGGKIPKSKDALLCGLLPKQHTVFGGQHVEHGDAINGDKIVERVSEEKEEVETFEDVTPMQKLTSDLASIRKDLADLKKTHQDVVAQNSRLLAIIENLTSTKQ